MRALPPRNVRLVLGLATITLVAGIAYITTTALYAVRASFPQKALLSAAMPFLEKGYMPAIVLPATISDINTGQVWMVITDSEGRVRASSIREAIALAECATSPTVNDNCFFVPTGYLKRHITLQFSTSERQAVIAAPWQSEQGNGYIFIGRSREHLDQKLAITLLLIASTWFAGMGAFYFVNRAIRR